MGSASRLKYCSAFDWKSANDVNCLSAALVILVWSFLLKPLSAQVSEIRDQTFVALKVNDSQEEALNVFRKYDRSALPVVAATIARLPLNMQETNSMELSGVSQ